MTLKVLEMSVFVEFRKMLIEVSEPFELSQNINEAENE